jgi:hypothetical protein
MNLYDENLGIVHKEDVKDLQALAELIEPSLFTAKHRPKWHAYQWPLVSSTVAPLYGVCTERG